MKISTNEVMAFREILSPNKTSFEEGPHVLYLHSGDGDSRNVESLMHGVSHAAQVTAVDMRGFG